MDKNLAGSSASDSDSEEVKAKSEEIKVKAIKAANKFRDALTKFNEDRRNMNERTQKGPKNEQNTYPILDADT